MSNTVHLGTIPVGPKHPPVFLAEIGTFFGQDIEEARRMTRRILTAREACPQTPLILKGEVLHDANVCLDDDTMEPYVAKDGTLRRERYRELVERKVVPLDRYRELFNIAREHGLPFVLSVYDFVGADFAAAVGAAAIKIASANLTHIPLIRHAAKLGLPLLLDTGRAEMDEVARAVNTARKAGCKDLIVEHSPDGHPAPPENHNLLLLDTYAHAFQAPVGLSDHFQGELMLYLAVALGTSLVEKGVVADVGALDQDVAHAMALDDLPHVLKTVHDTWIALGEPVRPLSQTIRGNIGTSQRSGLVAKRTLCPGDRVNFDTVGFAWPMKGIPAFHWDTVDDWEVVTALPSGTPIRWSDVRPVSS